MERENELNQYRRRRMLLLPFFIVMLAAMSGAVMFLWNHLLPPLFGLKALTFWQAGGLLLLCRLLFGRFNRGHHHMRHHPEWHGMHRRMRHHNHGHIRVLRRKLMRMNEEERRQFIAEWRKRMQAHGR